MKIKVKKAPQPAARPAAPRPAAATASQFRRVEDVVRPDAIVYLFFKEWSKALERNDYPFIWNMAAENSPLRDAFGPLEDFAETCRRKLRPIPALGDAELRKIRLAGHDEAQILTATGHRERDQREYTVERWYVLRGASGWRVQQIDAKRVPRETDVTSLRFEDFEPVTAPAWFTEQAANAAEVARKKKAYRVET